MSARHFVWDVSALTALFSGACAHTGNPDWQLSPEASDLVFDDLAHSWDEAIPLGNATLGSLVWEQDSMVRMSLDRVDLWNLRPTGVWSITSSLVRSALPRDSPTRVRTVTSRMPWPSTRWGCSTGRTAAGSARSSRRPLPNSKRADRTGGRVTPMPGLPT